MHTLSQLQPVRIWSGGQKASSLQCARSLPCTFTSANSDQGMGIHCKAAHWPCKCSRSKLRTMQAAMCTAKRRGARSAPSWRTCGRAHIMSGIWQWMHAAWVDAEDGSQGLARVAGIACLQSVLREKAARPRPWTKAHPAQSTQLEALSVFTCG